MSPVGFHVHPLHLISIEGTRATPSEDGKLVPAFVHSPIAIKAFRNRHGRGMRLIGGDQMRIGRGAEAHVSRRVFGRSQLNHTQSVRAIRDIGEEADVGHPHLDVARIIDFAAAGQVLIITPFTLAGAMAPVTVAGALTLAHAEALAGLALAQIVRPGAPVVYGSFTSNVDMKSGSPAFGTPEYVKAAFGAGQLARFLGLPWRSSNATASNIPDAQSAYESQMSLWGALFGGCNFVLHAAGWLESGLPTSYEKFILDIEML